LVGNTVWRIKRRPVWTCWRQKLPPCLFAEGPARRFAFAGLRISDRFGSG